MGMRELLINYFLRDFYDLSPLVKLYSVEGEELKVEFKSGRTYYYKADGGVLYVRY